MFAALVLGAMAFTVTPLAAAQPDAPGHHAGGEANLVLPDLSTVSFLGTDGHTLLLAGLVVCALGLAFGLVIYSQLKNMVVHESMREISELIYETCKTYLLQQGKFLLILELFIGVIIAAYFGLLQHFSALKVAIILGFSLVGIAGSYGVAWFGIRVNTFANSRTAFASLRGKPYPCYAIPLKAGMSIGMMLISVELLLMLFILLFVPGDYAGPCFIGFAIGESLGAAALRIAGGIFTKIADIGSDLMKIVFKIKEDDARNPGVIADCTGDNAGDSVGPSADGFETYGVTGVALISFILLAVSSPTTQVQLLVWIFMMRIVMVVASGVSYLANEALTKAQYANADHMDYEAPLTRLVWLTSFVSIALTYAASYLLIPTLGDGSLWWKLSSVITCGTLAGAVIPELVKVFTSTNSAHVREVVISSEEGGASLNILSGFVAGNFSAYWLGMSIMVLMAGAYLISNFGFAVNYEKAKHFLEENDGAGNTFKATAKPVLIGTAVVGATTMIFSIIVALTNGLTTNLENLSILHAPFLLGLLTGGAIIYWFTGASTQAVTTGAYRAVEFIKANMNLQSTAAASVEDSKKVVEICTKYAQKGMLNIFFTVFFSTLAFAFVEPFFFIGYLISIAMFGLYQAIFMANAGGAWDNAKKIVEVELKQKGTDLHAATVVGDTVGDPFKDTSSVALNPIIKFTTLFGLLAVELAVSLTDQQGPGLSHGLAASFFLVSVFFVYRSFYGMRIESK